jgi:hypothetical protein
MTEEVRDWWEETAAWFQDDVHDALVDAGFRVERIREPGSPDPDDYEEGPWGEVRPELLAKLPSTLIFEARVPEGR